MDKPSCSSWWLCSKDKVTKSKNVGRKPTEMAEDLRSGNNSAQDPELNSSLLFLYSPYSPVTAKGKEKEKKRKTENKKREEKERARKEQTVDQSKARKKSTSSEKRKNWFNFISISDWSKCSTLEEMFDLPVVSLSGVEGFLAGARPPLQRQDRLVQQASFSLSEDEMGRVKALRSSGLDDIRDLVSDVFAYMRSQELKYCVPESYIEQYETPEIGFSRFAAIDWIRRAHLSYFDHLDPFFLAVSFFDRFMLAVPSKPEDAKLVALSCLNIALMLDDVHHRRTFVDFGVQGKKMEKKIAFALGFKLLQPLSCQFLWYFNQTIPDISKTQADAACFFLELQLVRHEMLHICPSLQAAAALLMSLFVNFDGLSSVIDYMSGLKLRSCDRSHIEEDAIGNILKGLWSPTIRFVTGYSFDQIEEAIKLLSVVVVRVHRSANQIAEESNLDDVTEEDAIKIIDSQMTRIESIKNTRKIEHGLFHIDGGFPYRVKIRYPNSRNFCETKLDYFTTFL